MVAELVFPKIDGDILYASEANLLSRTKVIYADTGFNSSQASAGTDEQDHELTAISAADVGSADYLIIEATVTGSVTTGGASQSGVGSIKYQVKETGQSYSDSMTYKIVLTFANTQTLTATSTNTRTIKWIHTLTAGEKSNGVQVKVFSKSVSVNGTTTTVNNVQTSLALTL